MGKFDQTRSSNGKLPTPLTLQEIADLEFDALDKDPSFFHVAKNNNGYWVTIHRGRVGSFHETKRDAICCAHNSAKRSEGTVIKHF